MDKSVRLLQVWKVLALELQETYGYKPNTLIAQLRIEGDAIPLSAFGHNCTPLEAAARYLQHTGKTSKETAHLLGRTRSAIERALVHSHLTAKTIAYSETEYLIPANMFKATKPASEALCTYLREHYAFTNKQIADALGIDQRTVWTVLNRAQKRNEKKIKAAQK